MVEVAAPSVTGKPDRITQARAVGWPMTADGACEIWWQESGGPGDVAVLDVNLGVGTSMEVADQLVRRSVPFVFATGYGDTAMIPGALRSIPVVRKPHEAQSLVTAIARVLPLP